MRIAACTLFIALSVFLDSIELSSQTDTTLKELFPHFADNCFPTLNTFTYENNVQLRNLRKVDGNHLTAFNKSSTLVRRGNVIIGWTLDFWIRPIFPPGGNYRTCYVFNTDGNYFLTLSLADHLELGVNQRIINVLASDEVMTVRLGKLQSIQRENKLAEEYAHNEAAKEADIQASFESHVQARQPNQSQEARGLAIREAYIRTYNRVYPEAIAQYLRNHR